ncbi:hypothetical protein F2Q69_00030384 [Brassica cretica]|uniref:DAGKc domain-containing protein n=1 Tax=Brassica cretica TaxID=69181 RepID=A0A8S9SAQ7_BRACR|nr:hypothetical protein F2Q69_00030384 [Brassica cretica]
MLERETQAKSCCSTNLAPSMNAPDTPSSLEERFSNRQANKIKSGAAELGECGNAELWVGDYGGDGAVGWVLGCLGEFNKERTSPIPPVDIISTLGTGNDFSRILVG